MGYYETLIEMVDKSGLTLQEIADKCQAEYGVKINRSYISKLQTKRQAPASDEVNVAIAKVCGGEVERFRYEGYIEKAPEYIKELIQEMKFTIKGMTLSMLGSILTDEQLSLVEKDLNTKSEIELVRNTKNYLNKLPNIKADYYQVAKEEQDGKYVYKITGLLGARMNDDSMEPRIKKGTLLHIDKPEDIKSGDTVVVKKFSEEKFLVRKYVVLSNTTALISENPIYEPIEFDNNEYEILGKVKSITVEI
ncbi:S24 family peptidase [Brevibacillus ginsengisoli]|uniref:S24 family peptidase n=1 Tax=Brevibacillus ginsengisoli TaxID=363854 RepID=UPI003CF087D7